MPFNPDLENSLFVSIVLENLVSQIIPVEIDPNRKSNLPVLGAVSVLGGLSLVACSPIVLETQAEEIEKPATAIFTPTQTFIPKPIFTIESTLTKEPIIVETSPTLTIESISTSTVESSPTSTEVPPLATLEPTPTVGPEPWIEVDLSEQKLVFYGNEDETREFMVSTGLPQTPTLEGTYNIERMYTTCNMSGPGYFTEGVPYCMYFYQGYALHGAWWHNNFGQPMSHGCVNLSPEDAGWIFERVEIGTKVVVHE